MKHFYLLLSLTLLFAACSKDEFDRSKPQNGQEVELFVDHYIAGGDYRVFLSNDREERLYTWVENFDEREIGYIYLIKAKAVVPEQPLMDGPSYWFERIKTIRKDKYQGVDTFSLPLFGSWMPQPFFCMTKEADKFTYNFKYPLTPANDQVRADLEQAITKGQSLVRTGPFLLNIIVQHDPANYTKGYIVHRVAL
ncbi:hypothetical protein [Chitinophaga sp. S165]|uniref:hypothetical protein n=1 Tax=Chitinophaga sp. S165 TaxID=2135462 RepID=UPI000D70F4D0|nr:hypothetical protein [Chitinophaga sp. S165]PWV56351.1 hypothetical protein C7475_101866 [Chitinophaga sp. S165]